MPAAAAPLEHEGMDNEAIARKLEDLARANMLLLHEGDMFSRYLRRNVSAADAAAAAAQGVPVEALLSARARGAPPSLTHEQRMEVAAGEVEAAKAEARAVIDKGTTTLETLDALIAQSELRLLEVRKDAYEFKRDVVLGGESPTGNGKIMAEAVVRYYEEGLRAKETRIDKLRLKHAALRAQQQRLQEGVATKAEAGGVLHYIDFHQLQIENAQFTAKIEERNNELLRLKLTTGNAVAALSKLRSRLAQLVKEASVLRNDIKVRTALLAKLRAENVTVVEIVERQSETASKLVASARSARGMPQTIDYVEMTRTQAALEHELQSWDRKIEIATLKARQAEASASQRLRASGAGAGAGASAGTGLGMGMGGGTGAGDTTRQGVGSAPGRTMSASFFGSTGNARNSPAGGGLLSAGSSGGGGDSLGGGPDGGGRGSLYSAGASTAGAAVRTPATGMPSGAGARGLGLTRGSGASSGAGPSAPVLPNYADPVGFGSTTRAPSSATRPLGSVAAALKTKPGGFREQGFKPPRGAGGGFVGQVASSKTGERSGVLLVGAAGASARQSLGHGGGFE